MKHSKRQHALHDYRQPIINMLINLNAFHLLTNKRLYDHIQIGLLNVISQFLTRTNAPTVNTTLASAKHYQGNHGNHPPNQSRNAYYWRTHINVGDTGRKNETPEKHIKEKVTMSVGYWIYRDELFLHMINLINRIIAKQALVVFRPHPPPCTVTKCGPARRMI